MPSGADPLVWGLVAATALALVALLVGVALARRQRALDPSALRWRVLTKLGYVAVEDSVWRRTKPGEQPPRRWTMPLDKTQVTFTELGNGGFRWTVGLHQYDILELHLDERTGPPRTLNGHRFAAGVGALDDRFLLLSETPDRSVALVHDPDVVRCLLDMPFVALSIHGDQLVIEDREGLGRERLLQSHARRTARLRAQMETEVHQRALALILVVLGFFHRVDGDLRR